MKNQKKVCQICQTIKTIKTSPFFVKELKTGYVVLGDFQFYRGYTLFLSKKHVTELHYLPADFSTRHFQELILVGKAIWKAFKPIKLNYELLGNTEPHLHWHIFPRHKNDPKIKEPIWCYDENIRNAKKYRPSLKELAFLRNKLLAELNKL